MSQLKELPLTTYSLFVKHCNYTLRLSSFGGVALRDSPSAPYKNTLLGLTTRAPTRILEIRRVY
jgi:hypothetical protein